MPFEVVDAKGFLETEIGPALIDSIAEFTPLYIDSANLGGLFDKATAELRSIPSYPNSMTHMHVTPYLFQHLQ